MADAMMMFLGEAHGVNWYWAQPGEFENPGVYYWDGAKNVLCVPHLAAAPEAPAQASAVDDDYKGWYCAHCQRGVDASEVTFREQHQACGRVITDDRPPKVQASAMDERAEFEAWALRSAIRTDLGAWEAWQARAALAQKGGAA